MVTKVKPNINSVEVHPQLSNEKHPMDGVPVGAGPLGPNTLMNFLQVNYNLMIKVHSHLVLATLGLSPVTSC
jgi:hypothetical protein